MKRLPKGQKAQVMGTRTFQTMYTAEQMRKFAEREWVSLTDAEFQWIYDNGRTPAGMIEMAEAKLREKNSGETK